MTLKKKSVVILGAGLSGLSAAWVLSKNGFQVTLLEKSDHSGGLAITKERNGYKYDLGPHNIHTIHSHIITFFKRHFSQSLFGHDPRSKILKNNKFIDYPLKGVKVITSLPFWKLPIAILSFLKARIKMFLGEPKFDASFEAWIKNRFGKLLYLEYFGNYAGKVWGIAPDKIDKYVCEKRIPVIGLTELIRTVLFGKTARMDHPEFSVSNYYLKNGIGETVHFFTNESTKNGAQFEYNTSITGIETDLKVNAVNFTNANGEQKTISCDYLLSTIPINESVFLFKNATEKAKNAAKELDYCSTVLLFMEIKRRNILPSAMLYFSDPKIPFSRIFDVGVYSYAMVPEGKTMLCIEMPCNYGDKTWEASTETIAKQAISLLEREKILKDGDVEGFFLEKVSHSYPRFRLGFMEKVQNCFSFFTNFSNFLSYGRQGGFAYLNTDGVIDLGFHAADSIILAESMGYHCHEWFSAKVKTAYIGKDF